MGKFLAQILIVSAVFFATAHVLAQEATGPRITGIDYDFRLVRIRGEGFQSGQTVRLRVFDGATTKTAQADAASDGRVTIEQRKLVPEGGLHMVSATWGGVTYPLRAMRVPGGLALLGERLMNRAELVPTAFDDERYTTGTLTYYLRQVQAADGQTTQQQQASARRLHTAAAMWARGQAEAEAAKRRASLEDQLAADRARIDVSQ